MSTDVEDTPLFAEVAGEYAEHVLALIAGPLPTPGGEDVSALHPVAS